jgi:hypothetical protein
VTAEFDLNLLPLYRIKGQELPQLPGLLVAAPPKRAARGRDEDQLLIYLTISGNTPISTAEYTQITSQVAQNFYKTPGSMTFAARAAANWLNQFLLNRNLGTTGKGQYIVGRLILAILRGNQCTLAQCGPTHVFQVSAGENRQIHDAQIAGHGLGIGQATPVFLAQAELHAGDLLVLCSDLPAGWDAALLSERTLSPEMVHRKLLGLNMDDLNAVMAQATAGKGNLNILRAPRPAARRTSPAPAPAAAAVNEAIEGQPGLGPTARVEGDQPASRFARLISGEEQPASTPPTETAPAAAPVEPPADSKPQPSLQVASSSAVQTAPPSTAGGRFVSPRRTGDLPEIKRPSRRHQGTYRGLARLIQGIRGTGQKISNAIGRFLPNLVPGVEGEPEESGSAGWLLAIVIPVVIVVIGATVYVQYGRTTQFNQNYEMALNEAAQARGQTDPTEVRRAWESSLYYLDQAEKSLKKQPNALALRQEAQTALDNLDGILRLDFHSAIAGGLSSAVQISQMAATDTDLYLLDSTRGTILKATWANQIYQVDTSFKCGPGNYDSVAVDSLIGLVALPMSNIYNARVMGMDAKGTLLYCGLSEPVAVALVPPQLGWRNIKAFTLDTDGKNLYVLDPGSNAIWQYAGNFGQFTELPIMFFGQQVPQNMNSAITLAVNNADLYLLFQDGHVTACSLTRLAVAPVRCTDPITFKDTRPERQAGPRINDAIFTQMTFASAPDPSLYMLEPLTRAVYRFSPRSDSLELRGQFRTATAAGQDENTPIASGPATAMTISPNRFMFFSVGNQVYFATDVP